MTPKRKHIGILILGVLMGGVLYQKVESLIETSKIPANEQQRSSTSLQADLKPDKNQSIPTIIPTKADASVPPHLEDQTRTQQVDPPIDRQRYPYDHLQQPQYREALVSDFKSDLNKIVDSLKLSTKQKNEIEPLLWKAYQVIRVHNDYDNHSDPQYEEQLVIAQQLHFAITQEAFRKLTPEQKKIFNIQHYQFLPTIRVD